MQIFLIRHLQPEIDSSICYGQIDIALSQESLNELPTTALNLQKQLPKNIPIFSSPLLRCRILSEALTKQPIYDDRLMEMNFGAWEMQAWSEIPRHELDAWAENPLHYVIPKGESVAQCQKRLLEFIAECEKQSFAQIALITHAGIMKVLYGAQASEDWMQLTFDYGALQILEWNH